MEKFTQVSVHVMGRQRYTGDDEEMKEKYRGDMIESYEPGDYAEVRGKHYIRYYEMMHDVRVEVVVTATEDTLIVTRNGGNMLKSHLKFREGLRYGSEYRTMYGSVYIEVLTDRYIIKKERDVLVIAAEYEMWLNNEYTSKCIIVMEIKPRSSYGQA